MNPENNRNIHLKDYLRPGAFVHFIGCGGAGTMPLLKIFSELGFSVSGSDMAESEALSLLKEAKYRVYAGHRKENLPQAEKNDLLIVYSSAVKEDNVELLEAKRRSAKCILRGEALGLVAELFPCVIAVSGTHGKTSISSMIVHILEKASLAPGYLIGGNLPGKKWNGSAGGKKIFVCEADESDGTHTAVRAGCAVVSNIEDDHVWNFESEKVLLDNFFSFASSASSLVYNAGEKTDLLYRGKILDSTRVTPEEKNVPAVRKLLKHLPLYQKENAFLAAKCVEKCFKIPLEKALVFLQDFAGVGRRLSLHYEGLQYALIEDYAHHPTEVEASLRSLRMMYPDARLCIVFQPHRFARLERYFSRFITEFSEKEYSPENVFITPVFAAWTDTGKTGSEQLASAIGQKAVLLTDNWEKSAEKIFETVSAEQEEKDRHRKVVLAVLGAGDVQKILVPLKTLLQKSDAGEKTGVIVAAGGSSRRYGEKNKLFEMLGELPLFMHCLKNFAPYLPDGHIVLVVPSCLKEEFALLLEKYSFSLKGKKILLTQGGNCREESVYNGIMALPQECSLIAVHDGARPFADRALLVQTICSAEKYGGSIAARKVTDTIKETDDTGRICRTVPRENLWSVQTPQTFQKELLLYAFQQGEGMLEKFTDDSSLVERFTSCKPVVVRTEGPNMKITYAEDLVTAGLLLKKKEEDH